MWRIISTIDGDHVGEVLDSIEPGQVLTFADGDVISVTKVFTADDGNTLIATGNHYTMTLEKE